MWINLIRILSLLVTLTGGIVLGIGTSLIPQKVTNNGDRYIGDATSYNTDLINAQMASYGFKLAMIGVGLCGLGFIGWCLLIWHAHREDFALPLIPLVQPVPRRVRINPDASVITLR